MALWGTERARKQREKSAAPVDAVQTTTQESDGKQRIWAPVSLWTDRKTRAASGRNTSGEERCVGCSYFSFSLVHGILRLKENLFFLPLVHSVSKLSPFYVSCLLIFLHFWVWKRKPFHLESFSCSCSVSPVYVALVSVGRLQVLTW